MMYRLITTFLLLLLSACAEDSSSDSSSSSGDTGQGGSLATFTIVKDNLYVMDTKSVIAFSLEEPSDPQQFDRYEIDFDDGETIFNHQNEYVFVGKQSGVDLIELNDTGEMTFLAEHSHITSCDPVITQGNRSFVTTRSSTDCGGNDISLLEVLDITDLANPIEIFELEMTAPSGLAVSGDDLFICDLDDGLVRFKIFDTEDEFYLEPGYISNIFACNDIILKGDHLILNHDGGITQIQWTEDEFTVLSEMEITY